MQTQSTPIHVSLWHKDFWLLSLANMLMSIPVYMLIPVLPLWLRQSWGLAGCHAALLTGVYCIGLFSLGTFSSFLIHKFQRGKVCLLFAALMSVCFAAMYYLHGFTDVRPGFMFACMAVLRFVLGAVFGIAHIMLASTLIVDRCESFLRTEANHSAAWFFRFSLSLGPVMSVVIYGMFGYGMVLLVAAVCCLLSMLLIKLAGVPFKAPEETRRVFSLDRFFLPQGIWLFINQIMVMASVGILLSMESTVLFYGILMLGFFLALLAQKFVFVNAELRSEILTGLFFIACAVLLMLCRKGGMAAFLTPVFIGMGTGLTGSRFLLFFLKLGNHCQRGTSQTTFFLSWEAGLSAGLSAGYLLQCGNEHALLYISLALVAVSFVMYQFFTHSWYIRHKNR